MNEFSLKKRIFTIQKHALDSGLVKTGEPTDFGLADRYKKEYQVARAGHRPLMGKGFRGRIRSIPEQNIFNHKLPLAGIRYRNNGEWYLTFDRKYYFGNDGLEDVMVPFTSEGLIEFFGEQGAYNLSVAVLMAVSEPARLARLEAAESIESWGDFA